MVVKDDVVMWKDQDKICKSRVLNAFGNTVELEGNLLKSLSVNTVCGLWNMQTSMVMENQVQ